MKLSSTGFRDGQPIPGEYAFCVPDPQTHVTLAPNRNPALSWDELPAGTKSLVLVCHDPDVPTRPDDVNQEGRVVPSSLPRFDFYHWVLVDIPPSLGGLDAGAHSDGVSARGKAGPDAPGGMRHGLNNYTDWFSGDPDMEGSISVTTGPARRGTTASCTTTCSPSSRSGWSAARWKAYSAADRFSKPSNRTCWHRPASPGPTA